MRASDRDRERTVARLGRGYASGSLGTDTFALRVDGAYRAKDGRELRGLTRDLPRRLRELVRDELAGMLERLQGEPPPGPPAVSVALPPDGPGPWLIGRSSGCRLVVDHDTISRYHAELRRTHEGWEIHDLGSTNGTRVNGWRVERAAVGVDDDVVLGGVRVRLRAGPGGWARRAPSASASG
jgi:hypothetical protein